MGVGARKPSGSGVVVVDELTGSIVEAVDWGLGAVGAVRSVVKAAGAIVCRMGVLAAKLFRFAGWPDGVS